jgi:hypothetical protein
VWSSLTEWAIFLVVLWMLARVLSQAFSRSDQPAEPDDYADIPSRLRPRPKRGAGAVALAEPDGEDEDLTVHPPISRRRNPRH